MYLTLTFDTRIVVQVVEDFTLTLEKNCLLELKDCLHILESRKNLISISSSCNQIIQFFH